MNFRSIKSFRSSLGPLEQAAIVITAAIVVALITIIAFRVVSAENLTWYDLVSFVLVGIIGFIILFSTFSYGRQSERQKQEILALKTIAEAVSRAVDIPYLLQNALQEVRQLLEVEFGWIYRLEGGKLVIAAEKGTEELSVRLLDSQTLESEESLQTLRTARIHNRPQRRSDAWPFGEVESWGSVPIMMKDQFFGLIVVGSRSRSAINNRHIELMAALANQVGVAMENAALFSRLRQSEERYMDLYEHSPDMYHIVNRDGIIVSCNQTEVERLGYKKEDLVGQSILKLYIPSYHAEVRRLLKQIFEHGRQVNDLEEQMLTSAGELIEVSVNTSILYDDANRPSFARAVARDITEKKKLEAKVVHAQRIDSIGNLAGGVAHDFNNILTSILGSTSIMKKKMKKNVPMYRFVDIIETAARRGADLTRQLLTFARKTSVQFKPLIVNDIVEETLQLFERSIPKSISVAWHPAEEVLLMNGDDGQVQQSILNLLINARDAMPEGGLITVNTRRMNAGRHSRTDTAEMRSSDFVVVDVSDTGMGMDLKTQHRIFEPFFTTKDQGKGTGLGLAVVYGVVNAHSGFITVDSEPGKGSRFRLHFPLLAAGEPTRRVDKPGKPAKGLDHILIVDDEKDVGDVIVGMLKSMGYKTKFVTSGRKAIAAVKRGARFSAVILDLNMPDLTGRETLLKLREIDPSIRVILSTGYSNKNVDVADLLDSVDGFLQKPYQSEELSQALRPILRSQGGKP